MGKKNYRLKEEKYREQVTRYSLRKLSIGVASVALFSFVLSSPQAHAATSSESNTSNAASVRTSGASASPLASMDDVRVAGNQASDGNLIDKTTTTTGTLDPKTNLSTNDQAASLDSEVNKANAAGVKTTQTADQTYDDVQAAGDDYANQINNLNKTHAATSSESNTSNAASVQTSGTSASPLASTDDVRVAGNQASDGNLINKKTTTTTTKDSQGTTTTTTTTGTLDPKTNLSTNDQAASLDSEVNKANAAGVKTTQTADQTYDNVQAAGNDYANQINNLNKTTSDYKQAVQAFQDSLKKYNDTVNSYQVAKQEYEQALAKYNQEQAEYQRYKERNAQNLADFKNDSNLTDVSQTTTSSNGNEETVTSATVKLPTELEKAIKEAQQPGMTVNQNDSFEADSSADALSKYATMTEAINREITEYQQALSNYEAQKAVYDDQNKKWDEEDKAFKEYQKQAAESQGAGVAVAAQGLVFEQQKDAMMTIEGADTYMTKEVSDQLNSKDVISRFDKASLDAMQDASGNKTAYQQNNPHGEAENTWIVLKKGQPVTVTYHNLTGATYNGKQTDHVVYKYGLESSSDGTDEVMAQIMHDPTETIWVGSNSTNPNNHLRVKMTIAFYGSDGNKFDTSDGKAVLSLASLNHYTTIPYISDSGQQETIQMNHLERVNIGNNEFVGIPGSSVTLNENGWVYSVKSNQRVPEGATFDADDMYGYVKKQTGETFYTSDSDITNNKYILAHGGAQNWTLASKTVGWDDVPSANDGKWPVNKYYGAGAMKLTGDSIEFDVSGNTPDFNTSYWFNINSSIAVPQDPGNPPVQPVKPTANVEYKQLTVSKSETVKSPTAPKPEFDQEKPGEKPQAPEVPSAEWHLAKVVKVAKETVPDKPAEPNKPAEPSKPSQPTTPAKPVNPSQPTTPAKPVNPGQPTTPVKPVNPSQPTTPVKPVNPSQPTTPAKPVQAGQAAATNFVDQRLPQTGETDQQHMTLSGLLLLAMSSVLGLFGMTNRQRKE